VDFRAGTENGVKRQEDLKTLPKEELDACRNGMLSLCE